MPILVCAVCLAHKRAGKETMALNVGYLTMVDGTYYCDEHIPKVWATKMAKVPLRKGPKIDNPPSRKRGRPKGS